jgi:polyferredoxin
MTMPAADVSIQRSLGQPFALAGGMVENGLRVKITNRDSREHTYTIGIADRPDIAVASIYSAIRLAPGESMVAPVRVLVPPGAFEAGRLEVKVRVSGDGVTVDRPCRLLGPLAPAAEIVPRNP